MECKLSQANMPQFSDQARARQLAISNATANVDPSGLLKRIQDRLKAWFLPIEDDFAFADRQKHLKSSYQTLKKGMSFDGVLTPGFRDAMDLSDPLLLSIMLQLDASEKDVVGEYIIWLGDLQLPPCEYNCQ